MDMRVTLDIGPLATPKTGVGQYTYQLARALLGLLPDLHLHGFAVASRPLILDELSGRIPTTHLRIPARAAYAWWNRFSWPPVERLLGRDVDLLHATNYFLPPVRNARTLLSIHDISFVEVPELCSPKALKAFARTVPAHAARADHILTCSEASKRAMLEHFSLSEDRVTVTPYAVPETFYPMERVAARLRVQREHGLARPYLLFVSTLEPRKNVIGLIDAFDILADTLPHDLVLVGAPGWHTDALFARLEASPNRDRIRRIGFVPRHEDLVPLYSAADCFSFPTRYEGFGLPLLEAMTCGCPIVTSKTTSVPEVCGNAALYADAENPEAVAAQIRRVIEDSELRDALVASGYKQARQFSWARCAEQTLACYRKVLEH